MTAVSGGELDLDEAGMIHLDRLRALHVRYLNSGAYKTVSAAELVDALKQLAELLIWGESHGFEVIFDYFCEENLMEFLTAVLPRSPFKAVRIQLLQTVSMLIFNLDKESTLYYLLSNNYINTLITSPGIYSGGDVISWTVSLLKTLSGLLNPATIKFFYQEGNESFPLLEESIKFLSSSDSMKRAHVMTIILNVIRVNDPAVTRYIVGRSHIIAQIALYLRYCWRRLNKQIRNANIASVGNIESILLSGFNKRKSAHSATAKCDDVFQFIQDVMDLGNVEINRVLLNRVFTACFFPLMASLMRAVEHDAPLFEAVKVPRSPQCSFFRETYQRLSIINGLVGVYASNKSEIFSGNSIYIDSEAKDASMSPRTMLLHHHESDSGSSTPHSSPRSVASFSTLNISTTLLTNELLPNVAYYLLSTHLASARRDDIRHLLLLMTHCPFVPRPVLDRVMPFNRVFQNGGDHNLMASDTSGTADEEDDRTLFALMDDWERHVFGEASYQVQGGAHNSTSTSSSSSSSWSAGSKQDKNDYVLNLFMGEFVRVATCALPRADSCLAMLMALSHSLQNSFMKLAPHAVDAKTRPFEAYIAIPSNKKGLHIVLQLLNSVCRYLNSPALRIQVLNVALCMARYNADTAERYNPGEVASLLEELRFHLDYGFNTLRLLLADELEKCTVKHLSIFYDEWLRFDAGTSRRVDILEYPHVLLPTSLELQRRAAAKAAVGVQANAANSTPEDSPAASGTESPTKDGVTATPMLSPKTIASDPAEPKTNGDAKEAAATPAAAAPAAKAPAPTAPPPKPTRSAVSLWFFGESYDPSTARQSDAPPPSSNRSGAPMDSPRTTRRKNETWNVAQERFAVFRRHTQVALLLREINNDLAAGVLSADRPNYSPTALRNIPFERCPLLKGQQITINGTTLALGAQLSLDCVNKYPCTMMLAGDHKRRYVVCHDVFFLLVRERPQTTNFEATCIHPLWNVDLKGVETSKLTCTVAITWYPESKTSPRAGYSYCDPTKISSVTEFDLVFSNEEHILEYTKRYKAAMGQLTKDCSQALRDYFLKGGE